MPIVNKLISTKDFMKSVLENKENEKIVAEHEMKEASRGQKAIFEANEGVLQVGMDRDAKLAKYRKFLEDTKVNLLSECIYKIYNESQGITIKNDGDESIKRALVEGFIRENGVNNLLAEFKYKNVLLSEFACLVESYHEKIMEATDKNAVEFSIDTSITDDFFRDLNIVDTDNAIDAIKMRVTAAMDEFIQANVAHKADIEQALKDAKDKAFLIKDDTVKESYEHQAKRKISIIRNKPINVFGAMVQNMAEAVMKNDDLKPEYMVEGKLDMDKIVERTKLMYSFLEVVNTTQMETVNEEYVRTVLDSMKQ